MRFELIFTRFARPSTSHMPRPWSNGFPGSDIASMFRQMTPRRASLRWRLAPAFLLLAVAVCAFFAGVSLYVEQELEQDLMEARLQALADWQSTSDAKAGLP